MNRRGFFRLVFGTLAVATAVGVHPKLLSPVKKVIPDVKIIHGDYKWHHIALVSDRSIRKTRFFLDGQEVDPKTWIPLLPERTDLIGEV